MINWGGWLLLSVIFSILVLIVSRAEKKRRRASFIIMLAVWSTVWAYGIYRMSTECDQAFQVVCKFSAVTAKFTAIAWNTTNTAAVTAVFFYLVFWFVIGRYNPPGTSDDIRVIGLKDGPL